MCQGLFIGFLEKFINYKGKEIVVLMYANPKQVIADNGATGTKLRKTVNYNGSISLTKDYVAGCEYKNWHHALC